MISFINLLFNEVVSNFDGMLPPCPFLKHVCFLQVNYSVCERYTLCLFRSLKSMLFAWLIWHVVLEKLCWFCYVSGCNFFFLLFFMYSEAFTNTLAFLFVAFILVRTSMIVEVYCNLLFCYLKVFLWATLLCTFMLFSKVNSFIWKNYLQ